jgi:hypothetical protein
MKYKAIKGNQLLSSKFPMLSTHGFVMPHIIINYDVAGKRAYFDNNELTFVLYVYGDTPIRNNSTIKSNYDLDQKCTLQSKGHSTGSNISNYADDLAQEFAHPKDKLGIVFTPSEIKVIYGALLNEGYNKISEYVKKL